MDVEGEEGVRGRGDVVLYSGKVYGEVYGVGSG